MHFRDKRKDVVITCPICGREYLPAEIFVPNSFFGKPTNIDRFTNGEIEVYDGSSMDTAEEYTCDNCGETFVVNADIHFKVTKKDDQHLKEEFISQIYPTRISLFEEDNAEKEW